MELETKNILEEDLNNIYKKINNNFFKNKKILITGCEGFIGFYLMNYFIKFSKKIKFKYLYLADIKYKRNSDIFKNIKKLKFNIINGNINSIDKKLDIIIHAASIASPSVYRKYPLETADSNVIGLRKILEYSKNKNSKVKILYFSTSEIYGDPEIKKIPTDESYRGNVSCTGPRACYDESKRYSETLCYIFAKYYKVPVVVVRPFNNFGPGLKISDGRLPADLANSILKNKNIILFSNGKPTRSFCYISDAIVGFLKALTYAKYDVFNIGNDFKEVSVYDLAKIYLSIGKKYFNYTSKILFKKSKDRDYLTHNPNRRCPNINKSRKYLKFKPQVQINEGIKRYLTFLKYNT